MLGRRRREADPRLSDEPQQRDRITGAQRTRGSADFTLRRKAEVHKQQLHELRLVDVHHVRVTERVASHPVDRRLPQPPREPGDLADRIGDVTPAEIRAPAYAIDDRRHGARRLGRPGVKAREHERRVEDNRAQAARMAHRVGLGVGGAVREAEVVEAAQAERGPDGLDVGRDVVAAVEVRPAAELAAALRDVGVKVVETAVLERLAVDRVGQPRAAVIDQHDVPALAQRADQVRRELLAALLRGRCARAAERRHDRAIGLRGARGVREDGEEDPIVASAGRSRSSGTTTRPHSAPGTSSHDARSAVGALCHSAVTLPGAAARVALALPQTCVPGHEGGRAVASAADRTQINPTNNSTGQRMTAPFRWLGPTLRRSPPGCQDGWGDGANTWSANTRSLALPTTRTNRRDRT